jgi:glycosyltransferase involved in cell wall biosynthesis
MAGPGIRYRELARVLAQDFQVTLAAPGETSLSMADVALWSYDPGQWDSLAPAVEQVDAILLCGDVLTWFPMLEGAGVPLVVDGYDPHTLETLALFAGTSEQQRRHRERECILKMQCRAGDFFVCASERQRDWWLGLLEAAGRINARTYNDDPSLRRLIEVVPFGLPSTPPRHTQQVLKGVWVGIGPEDKVVLWGGGLWQWLDPLTAIRAMALVREQRDDVKLVFPGTRHPNPAVPDMPMHQAAVQLAEELGLRGQHVFFGDWVPYEKWSNYLLESDVGLSLHFDTIETRLAFRGRVLDYIWAGLPMVVTQGDATSDLVVRLGLGEVIGYAQEEELATALLQQLEEPAADLAERFAEAREELTWEKAAAPLVSFLRSPSCAADRADDEGAASLSGPYDSHQRAELEALRNTVAQQEAEIARLRELITGYEQGRFIRMMKWLHELPLWKVNA